MRLGTVKAVMLGLALASTGAFVGCSSHSNPSSSQSDENSGTVGLQLQVAPGFTVNTVHYVIANPAHTYSGDINVADSSTLTAVIGGIAAGTGYTLDLTATATDGTTACSGHAGPFTVTA